MSDMGDRSAHDRLCDEIVAYLIREDTPTRYIAICDATAPDHVVIHPAPTVDHDAKVAMALIQLRQDRRVALVGMVKPRSSGEIGYMADRAKNAAELAELLS